MTKLRSLTAAGLSAFTEYLASPESATDESMPMFLLENSRYSEAFADVEVPRKKFASRLDLASSLNRVLKDELSARLNRNVGVWSWLALFYLEQLAPLKDGERPLGKAYRYILSEDFRHVHRHLVAGAYYIFRKHREHSRALLTGPVSTGGDLVEQIGSRMDFIFNEGLIRTVDALYFDPDKERPKKGATNRKKPGTVRRFITVLQQLERTYDLYGMDSPEILALLPPEFNSWRSATR
jgi:hypothetical protein